MLLAAQPNARPSLRVTARDSVGKDEAPIRIGQVIASLRPLALRSEQHGDDEAARRSPEQPVRRLAPHRCDAQQRVAVPKRGTRPLAVRQPRVQAATQRIDAVPRAAPLAAVARVQLRDERCEVSSKMLGGASQIVSFPRLSAQIVCAQRAVQLVHALNFEEKKKSCHTPWTPMSNIRSRHAASRPQKPTSAPRSPELRAPMRLAGSVVVVLTLLAIWINVHFRNGNAHLAAKRPLMVAEPGHRFPRALRNEPAAQRASARQGPPIVKRDSMQRRPTASCEGALRVLCIVPIVARTSEKFAEELRSGTEMAKLLLSPRGSGNNSAGRCDSVRLYTTEGADGVQTRLLDLGGGRHDPRALLVDLVLVHDADSYTNLWEKVYTAFAHAWAAGVVQRGAPGSGVMGASELLASATKPRPAVAALTPQLCDRWETVARKLFAHNAVLCAEACQRISDSLGTSHSAGAWNRLEHYPTAIKWWLDAKCATDPKHRPGFDWYVKLDLDTVFVGENFRALACESRFNVDAPLAIGHRATHRRFPVLLGGGYAINQAAMERVMPRINFLSVSPRRARDHEEIECITFATASEVSKLLCTVTLHANRAHNLTRSP